MKKVVAIFTGVFLVLLLTWLMQDRFKGFIYSVTYSPEQILIKQLMGDGCGYHLGYPTRCNFDVWWFSGGNIRNADYYCPMIAAECIVDMKINPSIVLPILESIINNKPAEYDTGDGVIQYKLCIDSSIEKIKSGYSDRISLKCY